MSLAIQLGMPLALAPRAQITCAAHEVWIMDGPLEGRLNTVTDVHTVCSPSGQSWKYKRLLSQLKEAAIDCKDQRHSDCGTVRSVF